MRTSGWLPTLVLAIGAFFMAAPFILMVGTSLMTYAQTVAWPPEFVPRPATLEHYRKALGETALLRYLGNSLLVAFATVVGQVATGAMAGWAFARMRFGGRDAVFFAVLATMMVPIYVNLVPLYALFAWLGLIDTYAALILPGLTGAFGTFLFRQWFLAFPTELEDAARVDGAGPWRLFWSVALPTAWPAIATLAIFEFLAAWNTFLWPLVATNSDAIRTLPVGLAAFRSSMKEVTDWGLLMAATAISVVPAVLVFLAGQRAFVRGLMEGAVKD